MPKNKYNKVNILFFCYLLVLFFIFPFIVQAKESNPLTEELSRLKNQQHFEDVNQNLRKAERFLEDKQADQKKPSVDLMEKTTLQKITKITVDVGGEKVSLDFDKVINNYLNQPLSTKTVFALTKELTEVLYRAGYVTSAIGLKSSKITNGEIQFIVLWGKVDDILVERAAPTLFKDRAMILALPDLKGKLLCIYDIDQMIETLNTTNKTAKISVVADDKKGFSNLSIDRQRSYYPQIIFGLNNSGAGNNANGRNQATLNISWSDILGTNDRWNFSTGHRFYKNRSNNRQNNYSLSYVQPLSFSSLEIKLSESSYEKLLIGLHSINPTSGKTQATAMKLSHTLLRNKETILSMYGELEFKRRFSYFSDILIGKYHNNKLNLGLSYITNLGHGKLYSDLSYSNGLRWFNANYSAYDESREKTLKLISGSINWNRPFFFLDRPMTYQSRLGMQYSFDSVYSENQFSIGDEYTVRGFKGGVGSGDSGAYLSQTITIPFYPEKSYLSQISPFVGIDIGKVYSKRPHNIDTLIGFALGAKAQIDKFSLSITYANPINGVGSFEDSTKKPVYYFSGSISF